MSVAVSRRLSAYGLLLAACVALAPLHAAAVERPLYTGSSLAGREFFLPELYISSSHAVLDEVLERLPSRDAWQSFLVARAQGADHERVNVFIDPRSGAVTNLLGAFPLIPGAGVGNDVTAESLGARLGRSVDKVDARTVAEATADFIRAHQAVLGVDAAELGPVRAVQVSGELWQVSVPQQVNGVRVRHALLGATVNNGNLVLLGTETWGRVQIRTRPRLDAAAALEIGFAHAGGRSVSDEIVQAPQLELLPIAPPEQRDGDGYAGPVGAGYRHRLVWSFQFRRTGEPGAWEPLVDAHSGELLAFEDRDHYLNKTITGGVYPVTNTGVCPTPQTCGTLQSNWPMPWADTGFASPNNFTNSGGVYNYTSGTAQTTLTGQYVDVIDTCGAISATSTTGSINLGGTNGQHDCTTPGTGGAGNTAAARTAFYELNKIAEIGRGWLPANTWLQAQLPVNVNTNSTCGGSWLGSSISVTRSGNGCANTGELAGVLDHEWGHGVDDNDTNGVITNPGEAYADIAAVYRLQASCVGHGFRVGAAGSCGLAADGLGPNANEAQVGAAHCNTNCSGVRDADYLKHNPNTPDTALGFVCSSCSSSTSTCGRQVHCASAPVRQAAWNLVARDLPASPFLLDSQTSFLIGNRLFYQGSGNIGSWYSCTCGSSSSGCGATNGYMSWLAADDTNGNVNDGTPHMTAIYNAFNRHGIACAAPAPVNSGCTKPAAPATLTVTPGSFRNTLSWSAVTGAAKYWVLRTEGHAGCNLGKVKLAEVTTTSYVDTQVLSGRTYYYNIVTQAGSAACFSKVSTCVSGVPTAAPEVEPLSAEAGE